MDDADTNKALVARLGIKLSPYSDPGGAAARAWNVWDAKTEIALAATFVVSPDGTVIFRYVGTSKADRPGADDLLEAIDAAQ